MESFCTFVIIYILWFVYASLVVQSIENTLDQLFHHDLEVTKLTIFSAFGYYFDSCSHKSIYV